MSASTSVPEGLPTIDITIGIPCYNEEERIIDAIEHNIEAVRRTGKSYEIIVVDDGSKDRSVERVRAFCAAHPDLPVTLKCNDRNRGLAYNFVEAALLGRGHYYRMSCGDDPQPTEALFEVFRYIGKCDLVIPYLTDYGPRGSLRNCISYTFTFMVNLISDYNIRYYNGLPIFVRKHVLRWHPSSYGFGYSADMITRLLDYEGLSYIQVPTWSFEKKGKSSTSLTFRNLLSVTHSLLEITFRRIRRFIYGRESSMPQEIQHS
jgi:glycosyltransferase involved in cell wall biosynthesis